MHGVGDDGALYAAGQIEQFHAAVVGGDERSLGRGKGNDEVALGMFAADGQWAGEADGDLGHTGKVFDVALCFLGVKEYWEMCASAWPVYFFHEILASLDYLSP